MQTSHLFLILKHSLWMYLSHLGHRFLMLTLCMGLSLRQGVKLGFSFLNSAVFTYFWQNLEN